MLWDKVRNFFVQDLVDCKSMIYLFDVRGVNLESGSWSVRLDRLYEFGSGVDGSTASVVDVLIADAGFFCLQQCTDWMGICWDFVVDLIVSQNRLLLWGCVLCLLCDWFRGRFLCSSYAMYQIRAMMTLTSQQKFLSDYSVHKSRARWIPAWFVRRRFAGLSDLSFWLFL